MKAERIKVMFVAPSLSGGGAERFVSTLATHLDRDRFQVSICLMRDDRTYPVPADVSVTVLHKRKFWHLPRTIFRLRRLIASERPDVVVGTITFTNWLIGAAVLCYSKRPRTVACFANNPEREYGGLYQKTFRHLVSWLLSGMDGYVANSAELSGLVDRWYRLKSPCNVVRYPVDFEAIENAAEASSGVSFSADSIKLIAVGRLVAQKRMDELINVFARIAKTKDVKLDILGDGPLRQKLQHQITSLGLDESVTIHGFVENPYPWIKAADIFVLSSEYEGLPGVLVEAQGLGRPAVATNCKTGPAEIIEDGKTGFLVPVNDTDAIERRLIQLIDDPELRKTMGENAARRCRDLFQCHQQVLEWQAIFERSLDWGSGRRV